MNKEKMYNEIREKNFKKIKEYLDRNKIKKFNKILSDICWGHPEKIIFDFLKYLIKNEKNISKQILYYDELNNFLNMVVHWPSYLKENIKIGRQILRYNPKNIEIKKLFIDNYFNPDLNEYITKKEIKKMAKEVLEKEPNDKKAKQVLEKLEKWKNKY